MIARLGGGLVRIAGLTVFAVALVWPAVSMVWHCLVEDAATAGNLAPSVRQWGLLWRSAWMSSAAAITALLVSLPAAMVLARGGRAMQRTAIAALLALVLLTPPMIFSFGWDRLLSTGVPGEVRCILIWSLWAFPIPAFLLSAGWSRGGRRAYEAALLTCSPFRALLVGTRPVLQSHVALSVVVLWTVFFGDYGVPHACGLVVYSTEMLGWASNARSVLEVVRPCVPAVGMTLLAVGSAWWLVRGLDRLEGEDFTPTQVRTPLVLLLLSALFLGAWVVPMAGLGLRMGSARAVVDTAHIYSGDAAWSMFSAGVAGVMSICLAWSSMDAAWLRRVMLGLTVVFGALPGALVGIAVKGALNRPSTAWLHDHWAILSICYTARFAWIAMLVSSLLPAATERSELVGQASVDGANRRRIVDRLLLPLHAWAFVAAGAVIATLSLGEVAASSLVRVPGFNPIAHVIIEKFHRFEDRMLASLSLGLILASAMAAALLVWSSPKHHR